MKHLRLSATLLLSLGNCANAQVPSANLKLGEHNLYSHEAGNVPADTYQYSLYVPKQFREQPAYLSWPVVIFLHEGEVKLPQQGTRNMVGARLSQNNP